MSEERPWPELDPAAFHGLAGDVVRTIGPHTEADPAGLLVDFMTCFGNAVNAAPHALADGARHPGRLFVVLVGQTSRARKGTARAQIQRLFEAADEGWSQSRVTTGLSTGEGLVNAVADPVVDDKGNAVGGVTDKRLLVVEPEFARVLGVAGREGNTLSAIVRQAWDSGRLQVMTRRDPLVATGAHVSIIGHVTVEELTRRLTDTEAANGFANRFLFVCVRRSKLLPAGGCLDEADFHRLSRFVRMSLEQARGLGVVRRTPEAEELWAQRYAELAEDEPGGLLGAVTARAEAQLLRLSVLFALVDGSAMVGTDHLEAAWALWQYAEDSARHIFGDTVGDEVADRLLEALRRAGPEGLDGKAQHDLFSKHTKADRLKFARKALEDRGLAITVSQTTGGRPREITFAVLKEDEKKAKEV